MGRDDRIFQKYCFGLEDPWGFSLGWQAVKDYLESVKFSFLSEIHASLHFWFFSFSADSWQSVSQFSGESRGNKELIKLSWIIVCKLYMLFQFFGVGIQSYLSLSKVNQHEQWEYLFLIFKNNVFMNNAFLLPLSIMRASTAKWLSDFWEDNWKLEKGLQNIISLESFSGSASI